MAKLKRKKPSEYTKKVAKVAAETVEVQHRLRKKYPQMFQPGWGKKKKKPGLYKRLTKMFKGSSGSTVRSKAISKGIAHTGSTWEKDKPSARLKRRAK